MSETPILIGQSSRSEQAIHNKKKSLPWRYSRALKALKIIEKMPWPNSESPYARIARLALFDVGEWSAQQGKKDST